MDMLSRAAKRLKSKCEKIKVILFDVDGILTTGHLYWAGEEVGFNRFFHAHDGYGLKIMKEAGYKVGIITGGNSVGVKKRFEENLHLDYVFMGNEDKRAAFNEIIADGFKDEEIFFMGDELFDIPLMKKSGLSATVPSASYDVQLAADYVTQKDSGMGCAREVIDLIRLALDLPSPVQDFASE